MKPETAIKLQPVFACLLLVAWPVYLVTVPAAWAYSWPLGLGLAVFPGIYLFTWICVLMHDSWHDYVPGLPNNTMYYLLTWLLLADPQVFDLVHRLHHSEVNTYADVEFYPFGEISSPGRRKALLLLEYTLGLVFTMSVLHGVTRTGPRFRPQYRPGLRALSFLVAAVLYVGCGALAHWVLGAPAWAIVLSYVTVILMGSFVMRHTQMLQHHGMIVKGTRAERDRLTRNLSVRGPGGFLLNVFSHGDAREHVLHHTMTGVYSRPIPGVYPLPPDAVYLGLGGYLVMLWRNWKAPNPPVVVSMPEADASEDYAQDAAEPAGGNA